MNVKSSVVALLLALLLAGALSACDNLQSIRGSGILETEERPVDAFTDLVVEGGLPVDVTVEPGGAYSMTVTIDNNLIDMVEHETVDGVLTVRATEPFRQSRRASIALVTPELRSVAASGGADVAITGVYGEEFSVRASGGADVAAAGEVTLLVVEASGGADPRLRDLLAERAEVTASGGAEVHLYASVSLEGSASGGADIRVYGNPGDVRVETSGGGEVDVR